MKFIFSLIGSALLSYAFGLFLPWWSVVLAGLLVGYFIPQKRALSFFSAFLGVALFWGIVAFYISNGNEHILAKRVSELVIKRNSPNMLILLTALIGGITAGISSLTARSLALLFRQE